MFLYFYVDAAKTKFTEREVYKTMSIIKNFQLNQLDYYKNPFFVPNVSSLFYPSRLIGTINPTINDSLNVEVVVVERTGRTRTFIVPMEVLTKKENFVHIMTSNMVLFDMKYISHLQQYLMDECRDLLVNGPIIYRNRALGWQDIDGNGVSKFILQNATLSSGHPVQIRTITLIR